MDLQEQLYFAYLYIGVLSFVIIVGAAILGDLYRRVKDLEDRY